jgi:hypothetical protein
MSEATCEVKLSAARSNRISLRSSRLRLLFVQSNAGQQTQNPATRWGQRGGVLGGVHGLGVVRGGSKLLPVSLLSQALRRFRCKSGSVQRCREVSMLLLMLDLRQQLRAIARPPDRAVWANGCRSGSQSSRPSSSGVSAACVTPHACHQLRSRRRRRQPSA